MLLPPLAEQRAIAHVLRAVQRAKEAAEAVVASARQLKRSLLRHLFTYGPVPVAEADRVPLKETEIGPIPEHWELKPLGQLIGDGPQNGLYKHASHYGEGTPILRIDAFNDGDIVTGRGLKCLRLTDEERATYALRAGDLVVNRVNGSVDILAKWALIGELTEPTVFESNMMRFRTTDDISPTFMVRFFQSPIAKAQIRNKARIIHQASINQQDLKSMLVPVPPQAERDAITAALHASEQKLAVEQARVSALGEVFRSLLRDLMTGRVRVHELGLVPVGGET